ncbi:DUF3267 domain-containing protein [Salibacterium aidingense]|uniref:DUF3267 domain-containing protein n=1 Tax=Salibacterium aidingense TaxID=384933 RepID=UPI000406141E|nr:DUF3267 domain-containing protein [Salibacterium aidingense]
MNCWKSINVKKEYNASRMLLFSLSIMILTFIVSYLGFSLYHHNVVYAELSFLNTILFLLLLFPFHSLLHAIPLRFVGVRMKWNVTERRKRKAPLLLLKFTKPVARNFYIASMMFPGLVINLSALAGALVFPSFMHYFVLVFSFNTGLAVYDFIYVKQLLGAPRHCFIEQNKNGMDILLKQPV